MQQLTKSLILLTAFLCFSLTIATTARAQESQVAFFDGECTLTTAGETALAWHPTRTEAQGGELPIGAYPVLTYTVNDASGAWFEIAADGLTENGRAWVAEHPDLRLSMNCLIGAALANATEILHGEFDGEYAAVLLTFPAGTCTLHALPAGTPWYPSIFESAGGELSGGDYALLRLQRSPRGINGFELDTSGEVDQPVSIFVDDSAATFTFNVGCLVTAVQPASRAPVERLAPDDDAVENFAPGECTLYALPDETLWSSVVERQPLTPDTAEGILPAGDYAVRVALRSNGSFWFEVNAPSSEAGGSMFVWIDANNPQFQLDAGCLITAMLDR